MVHFASQGAVPRNPLNMEGRGGLHLLPLQRPSAALEALSYRQALKTRSPIFFFFFFPLSHLADVSTPHLWSSSSPDPLCLALVGKNSPGTMAAMELEQVTRWGCLLPWISQVGSAKFFCKRKKSWSERLVGWCYVPSNGLVARSTNTTISCTYFKYVPIYI